MKSLLFDILHNENNKKGFIYKIDDYFLTILIILNIFAIVLESFHEIYLPYKQEFHYFEVFSVIVFTLEYLIRIWIADMVHPFVSTFKARKRYMLSPIGLIDLMAVVPFYLPLIYTFDARVVRILRLFRLFRLFKLSHYNSSFQVLINVINKRKNELAVTFFTMMVILVITSSIMYELEHEAQPDKFSNIGHSLWWAMATLTTIGYGDIYPITVAGRILAAITAIFGIGIIAVPTAIVSAGFIEEIGKPSKKISDDY